MRMIVEQLADTLREMELAANVPEGDSLLWKWWNWAVRYSSNKERFRVLESKKLIRIVNWPQYVLYNFMGKLLQVPWEFELYQKLPGFESISKSHLTKFSLFAGSCPHHMSIYGLMYIHIAHIVLTLIDSCVVICLLICPHDVLWNL